jgi:hypothetical protein
MLPKIAHRVIWTTGSCARSDDHQAISIPPKKRGWASCRISIPPPFPTFPAGSCRVGRRDMQPAPVNQA